MPPLAGVFDGSVERMTFVGRQFVLVGWAADIERSERPRQIIVYRDGEYLASFGINRERPEIAQAIGRPGLRRIGFRGVLPGSAAVTAPRPNYRVFAVLARGVAVELRLDTASAPAAEDPAG